MNWTTVAVLRGGPSSEYDVSLQTGAAVLSVLQEEPFSVRDIMITRGGEWLVDGFVRTPEAALTGVDVAFIALHGSFGEDGSVQRTLDWYGIPYTGSQPYASAIALNKALTKETLAKYGVVKMAPHAKINRQTVTNPRFTAESIIRMLGNETFVKPQNGGSSRNTFSTNGLAELTTAIDTVLRSDENAIVEKRIKGREATVGVLENYRDARHYVMPAVEIVPPEGHDFFDESVKYTGTADEICPGRFVRTQSDELMDTALHVHQTLGLRHYSRSNFIVADDGIYFLEVNTLPGLTTHSLLPKAMRAVGGSYRELVMHLLNQAMQH